MFGLDLKKLTGAIIAAALVVMVIGVIGDMLVQPKKHKAAAITIAAKAPAAPKEAEQAIPIATLLATADVDAGKKVSNKCKSCHDLTEKKKIGIGPPLWDIVQAGKGGNGAFKYSSAMSGAGGKWSFEDLDAFLASPKGFLDGTKMAFPGIKDAKDRANLVAFLRSLSNTPVELKIEKAATMPSAAKTPSAPKEADKAVPVAINAATADAAAGKKVSNKCKSCHDLTEKKKNGIGPPLWNIFEAGKGGNGAFKYSSAMSGAGGKWSFGDLDAFLASPKDFLKGTKMAFPGIKDAKDRANLIAFLRSLSDAPKSLPK